MLYILVFLVTLICSLTFMVTILYWYEASTSSGQDIRPLTMNTRNVILLWLLTLGGLLGALVGRLLWFVYQVGLIRWHQADPRIPGLDGPPVLMVHGLYHDSTAWIFFRRHLHHAGFTRQVCVRFHSLRITMDNLASVVERGVKDLEERYPGDKPVLVGHSLGGLAIRAWLAEKTNADRVRGVLTLGTPHRGSRLACLAIGPLGRSLLPGHSFFRDLAKREEESPIPCVALASAGDCMVLPLENLVPVTPGWQFRVTALTSHLGMLLSPAVHRMAAWELYKMSNNKAEPKPETASRKPGNTGASA